MEASGERPSLNIVGDKVALGPFTPEVLPLQVRWVNDWEAQLTLGSAPMSPRTVESERAWWERVSKGARDTGFVVYDRATLRPIGTTSLTNIDFHNRRAVFGILIGEREYRGKGYGTEATRLVLDYGFNMLGLHHISLSVNSYNEPGIRAYLRAGFRECGRWREAHRRGGRAYDIVLMDCLATEFQSPQLQRLLP